MAADPLINPNDMFGHDFLVDFFHMLLPLSKLRLDYCVCIPAISAVQFLVYRLLLRSFQQGAQRALSAPWSGILFQYGPHFILLVSMFFMWFLRRGGTPRAFIPVRSFQFVGLKPVACCILFLASSSFSCHRMGGVFLVFHLSISCMHGSPSALRVVVTTAGPSRTQSWMTCAGASGV